MWSQSTKRQEGRAWGVPFLPLDINASGVHFRVERLRAPNGELKKAVRPPLCAVSGVSEGAAREVMLERLAGGPFRSVDDLYARLALPRETFEALIRAGALDCLAPRREALYRVGVLVAAFNSGAQPLFVSAPPSPSLPPLTLEERYVWDFETTRFSALELHALDFARDQLRELGCRPLGGLRRAPRKVRVRTAGLVVGKQRPPTAKGFAFFVLEDGPVRAQLIISPDLWEEQRVLLRDASVLVVDGVVEDTGHQLTLKAVRIAALPSPIAVRGYHFA